MTWTAPRMLQSRVAACPPVLSECVLNFLRTPGPDIDSLWLFALHEYGLRLQAGLVGGRIRLDGQGSFAEK